MKLTLQKRLERCPLFAGIDDLAFLTRCFQPLLQRLEAGQRLDWQGGGRAAVVAEGCVLSGHTVTGQTRPGGVLGLEEALTGGVQPEVTAEKASTLLLLPAGPLFRSCTSCCPEHRKLAENAAGFLAEQSLALRARQELLLIRGTRPRLCAYLLQLRTQAGGDTITLTYNRLELAAYLNLSRPSLSRELCLMRDGGELEFYRETIRVLRPEALFGKLRFTKDIN